MRACGYIAQLRQVRAIGADKYGVVIDRVLISAVHTPTDHCARLRGREIDAVVDAWLNCCAFLVVIPSRDLDGRQLFAAGVELADLAKSLLPSLAAHLIRHAIRAP